MKPLIEQNSQSEIFQSLEVSAAVFSNDWKFSSAAGFPEIDRGLDIE
jgi:hypothetical protein